MAERLFLVQQIERLGLLRCGILPQGELTEADGRLLRTGDEARLRALLRFLDQALAVTDPETCREMLAAY